MTPRSLKCSRISLCYNKLCDRRLWACGLHTTEGVARSAVLFFLTQERILKNTILRFCLMAPLMGAGFLARAVDLLAQNPPPVTQSAGTIEVSARVLSSDLMLTSANAKIDSALGTLDPTAASEFSTRHTRVERTGMLIVTERVDHPLGAAHSEETSSESSELRVSLVFTAN